jgi:hypothetical protein
MQSTIFAMTPRTAIMTKNTMSPTFNSGQFHGGTGDALAVGVAAGVCSGVWGGDADSVGGGVDAGGVTDAGRLAVGLGLFERVLDAAGVDGTDALRVGAGDRVRDRDADALVFVAASDCVRVRRGNSEWDGDAGRVMVGDSDRVRDIVGDGESESVGDGEKVPVDGWWMSSNAVPKRVR